MGAQSLAVIGSGDGGFFLVTDFDRSRRDRRAEDLLDETCR